ncbi:hypothetical protein [Amnibacterium kyonggiense]|uniref:Uncharacterized protein n=1 Tax=Amnibacterium kyonggiense TaxID=595671 RepID=A0A4R7FQ68_9MICO|nr:hypothetical protein [Amnibacterium kyonggiense]TDS79873.1 hypothetical protein CLV52_0418 [Amnibacterium kyonggiense]
MRTWPGLAAIGAGLIHLGSAAGTSPAVLVPLALLGALELLWGVAALARTPVPAPVPAAVGIGLALVVGVVALLLPPSAARHGSMVDLGVPPSAFLGAGLLDLATGMLVALQLLRAGRTPGESRPVRFLLGAAAAAAVVAVVTTQSLAATSVGGTMQMH